jgi:hypothetical protein
MIHYDDFVLCREDSLYYNVSLNGKEEKKVVVDDEGINQETRLINTFANGVNEEFGKKTFLTQKLLDLIEKSSKDEKIYYIN